jgi:hypothetical protein
VEVQLAVDVELRDERHLARLVELSSRGARLQLALKLRPGDQLMLRRNGATVCGSIMWSDGSSAGVQFHELISEDVFLRLRRASLLRS